jgi:ribosome-binding factor A
MGKRRQEKMAVEVKRVISYIIQGGMKDPRIDAKTVSVTRVEVSSDISHAKVNISVLGDEIKQEETMKALKNAKGYLRSEVAKALKIKHAPELELRIDRSIEHGIKISSLLEELKENKEINHE